MASQAESDAILEKNQAIAYALYLNLNGRSITPRQRLFFALKLIGLDRANEVYSRGLKRQQYFILEVCCVYLRNVSNDSHIFLEKINESLVQADLSGYKVDDQDIEKATYQSTDCVSDQCKEINKRFCQDEEIRHDMYNTIIDESLDEARLIAHYLLPPSDISSSKIDYPDDVRKCLKDIILKWDSVAKPEKRNWMYLRSLLVFLEKKQLVEKIESKREFVAIQDDGDIASVEVLTQNVAFPRNDNEGDLNSNFGSGDVRIIGNGSFGLATVDNRNDIRRLQNEKVDNNAVENLDNGLKMGLIISEDLTMRDRQQLSTHLNQQCNITQQFYFEKLARLLKYKDEEVFNIKLNQYGGGFPAYEFVKSLCIRKAEMQISEFISLLQENGLKLSEAFSFLRNQIKCKTLGEIPDDQKKGFARTISKWLRPDIERNWADIANVMSYTKIDIQAIVNTLTSSNSYSAGDKLLENMQIRYPTMTLIDMCNYLADIGHHKAKVTVEKIMNTKVKKLKEEQERKY